MRKRGQLTILILVGIVLVVVILLIFFLINRDNQTAPNDAYFDEESVKKNVNAIHDNLEDCIDSTTKEALIVIAFQGGYIDPPSKKFDYSPVFFPYYYYEGKIDFPTIEKIESETAKHVNRRMEECVDRVSVSNIKIDYLSPRTTVKIEKQNAYFEIDMPVELSSEGHKITIDLIDFPINHNSSLYEIHEVAEYITNSHKVDPEYYCISCVAEMASERGLYVYLFPNVADELITGVMIYENTSGIADPYTFIFLNKYTGNEETPKLKP